jgi:hypothetical protein
MTEPKKVVVEYWIVSSTDKIIMTDAVNERIRSGWELYKGPAITVEQGKTLYAQAMVRKEDEDTRGAWG